MFNKKFLGVKIVYIIGGVAIWYFWDKIKPMVSPLIAKVKAMTTTTTITPSI